MEKASVEKRSGMHTCAILGRAAAACLGRGRGIIVAATVVAAGCGRGTGDRAELAGTVTASGKAVAAGSISLVPLAGTGGPAAGGFIAGGRYRLTNREGVRPGRFQVMLSASRKTGRMVDNPVAPGTKTEEIVDVFPPQFGARSTLEVEIKPGLNTLDVAIP